MRRSPFLFLLLLLVACGGDEPPAEEYYDANEALGVDVESAAAEPDDEPTERRTVLSFEKIEIGPERVTVEDVIEARATLRAGASAFAEIEYTWYVNDRDVMGVQRPSIDAAAGRFRKGDVVRVRASAIDEKGQVASIESEEIRIANGTPTVEPVGDVNRRVGIAGLRLEATDPDGDPITWSISQGPPGVSIDRRGVIQVQQVNLTEAYDGEVVVVASDPEGARGEFHVPVQINASREEVMGERTTTRERVRLDMTDDEYEKLNLDSVDRVMEMDDAEFERHTSQQEEREAEYLRKKREEERRR
jgi:hypothetical protein